MRGTSSIQTPLPGSSKWVQHHLSWYEGHSVTLRRPHLLMVISPRSSYSSPSRSGFFGTPLPPGRRRRSEATGYRFLFYNVPIYHTSPATHITVCSVIDSSPVQTLIAEYSDVFKPELHQQRNSPTKHGIHHHITTSGAPVYSRFRCLNPEKLAAAKTSFTEMERMGLCSKAPSPWASPLHMVHKSDGSWRPCGDYRRLNLITEPDYYPMPNIADFTNSIGTVRVFSKLDLLKGYFQVPVHPADVPKTAIITPFGSYVFHFKNIINHLLLLCLHYNIGGNHANGTRMLSCIVSSIIIYLCLFQIIVNYFIIVLLYRNKLFLILTLHLASETVAPPSNA